MSDFKYTDDFQNLRHWTGSGNIDTINYYSSPTAVQVQELTSRRTFFDVENLSIRFYDTLGSIHLALSLDGMDILRFSGNDTVYTVREGTLLTEGSVERSPGWHLLEIGIDAKYRVKVDGTLIFSSTRDTRQAFNIVLHGGIWDDLELTKAYNNDYQGGTGGKDDLKILDLSAATGEVTYTLNPGYFYADGIEYYHFANMGTYEFTPDPSGEVTGASGLPYVPGQPYFVVSDADVAIGSGYIKTPTDRDYLVSWEQDSDNELAYIPSISGAFDNLLVYEAGESMDVTLDIPSESTKLVLSDEGGTSATIKSKSSYIDYVKVGNVYHAYAEVLDTYGGPVNDELVTWYRVDQDDTITSVATGTTNTNGIATASIVVTEEGAFHVYAEVNPTSRPKWIQVQGALTPGTTVVISYVFQFDNNGVRIDSQEGRTALGQNLWGERWGDSPGTATGLSYPNPTTYGQWEALHPEFSRPPASGVLPVDEVLGRWNGYDFYDIYPSIVDAAGTYMEFMNPKYVARNGFWGQVILSGANIRGGSPTIAPAQIQNPTAGYEIDRDGGGTIGSYNDVQGASGEYDNVYYVFYQQGSDYDGVSIDMSGDFYFRGVAIYEEDLGQANSKIQDIISLSRLLE